MATKFKKPIYVTRPILPNPKKIQQGIMEIWESKQLTNVGEKHRELSSKLSSYFGNNNISLFNNGTTALMLLLKKLNLKGEVITTPFTFPATTHSLTWNNLTPVFCDIETDTMNIDADKIEKLITPKTSAILAVHIFGTPCNVQKIESLSKKYKIKVVYDAAHAFGVEVSGKNISDYGDGSIFSFHATKLFHTVEGGAVVAKNKNLIKQLNIEKNFGIEAPEKIRSAGINGKLNELQALVGLEVLKNIKKEQKERKRIKNIYIKRLKDIDGISFYVKPKNVKENFQYFVVRINKKVFGISRDELVKKLIKYNVFPSKYFYPLVSSYPHYKNLKNSNIENLNNAKLIATEVLALPFYGDLTNADVENICDILKKLKK